MYGARAQANIKPRCIPTVPHILRVEQEKAYEPDVISIGPYHHGKPHLEAMEVEKRRCFREIAKETKLEMDEFRSAMRPLAHEARMCYEMHISFGIEFAEFVEMMVLDGCFIVELICFKGILAARTDIQNDFLLLENQLPFFVIFKLYKMIVPDAGEIEDFAMLVLSFFELSHRPLPRTEFIHVLDLVHSTYLPSPQGLQQYKKFQLNSQQNSILCATELEYAGISFFGDNVENMKKEEQGVHGMFDIMFTTDTKVLKIPTLQFDYSTVRKLLNYMAYEHLFRTGEPTYFADYVVFMHNLINTSNDVKLLRESGIIGIHNQIIHDAAIARMFDILQKSIPISQHFYYAEIFDSVNKHCQIKWNKWKAAFKKQYCNSPWPLIIFFAQLIVLLRFIFLFLSYIISC